MPGQPSGVPRGCPVPYGFPVSPPVRVATSLGGLILAFALLLSPTPARAGDGGTAYSGLAGFGIPAAAAMPPGAPPSDPVPVLRRGELS